MSTFQVPDKTSISVVDGAADTLLIYDASATQLKKGTRNQILGIASAPLGSTDSQTVQNKTVDNTNTVTVKDANLTIQDDSDTTKQGKFQLSGVTTGTTRTYTLPDASSTLVDLSSSQTLTNKTLTSPTINTATITNPTVTVDTINEFTSANGVTIDGVKLKDGALATNNSVVTSNVTDSAITPAKIFAGNGSSWTWQNYTVTLANVTLGNGTKVATSCQIGKTVFWKVKFTFGTTSSVTGTMRVSLPVTSINYGQYNAFIGNAIIYDLSAATAFFGNTLFFDTTTAEPNAVNAASTYAVGTGITSTTPMTWANGDSVQILGMYEAA